MTITNAIKKLQKNGFTVVNRGQAYIAKKTGADIIEFYRNGSSENITCIRSRSSNDHDDSMSDYSAGVYVDNIAQAIRIS